MIPGIPKVGKDAITFVAVVIRVEKDLKMKDHFSLTLCTDHLKFHLRFPLVSVTVLLQHERVVCFDLLLSNRFRAAMCS